ncbi:Uncharacterised protein [uncultured archaeon]|nr:Uncharacterised protein [uncultured archaeon]
MNGLNATTELKLKARMTNVDELNYTIQVYPLNIEWKYADPEYIINEHRFKNDSVRQIIRNVVLKYKDFMYGTIKVGSKDYLFEVQVPKGFDTGNLKEIITQIGTEIKDEIMKNENEIETFRKFLEETEF